MGNVWWLEMCGATVQCRATLDARDTTGDTALHHSARNGHIPTTQTLLRLGADPSLKNGMDWSSEEEAAVGGHKRIVEILQQAGKPEGQEGAPVVGQRHPDGIGIHTEPPESIVFSGLQSAGCLRRTVNMAAGFLIAPPLPVTNSMYDSVDAGMRIVNVARGSIQSTEFDLEDLVEPDQLAPTSGTGIWESLDKIDGASLLGLLLYEAPGAVTPDAPGHWVAVRPMPGASPDVFFRLDPVRGPFQISATELAALLGRYSAWRLVRKGANVAAQRTAQLSAAHREAAAVLNKRDGL